PVPRAAMGTSMAHNAGGKLDRFSSRVNFGRGASGRLYVSAISLTMRPGPRKEMKTMQWTPRLNSTANRGSREGHCGWLWADSTKPVPKAARRARLSMTAMLRKIRVMAVRIRRAGGGGKACGRRTSTGAAGERPRLSGGSSALEEEIRGTQAARCTPFV